LQITKQMSTKTQDAIWKAVEKKNFTEQSYFDAVEEFARTFLCRANPWPPEELAMDIKNNVEDATVRNTLCVAILPLG